MFQDPDLATSTRPVVALWLSRPAQPGLVAPLPLRPLQLSGLVVGLDPGWLARADRSVAQAQAEFDAQRCARRQRPARARPSQRRWLA